MHDVEKEGGPNGVVLIFGGQHALGDVSSPPGFCPRIPCAPPLHGQRDDQDADQGFRIGKIRQDGEFARHIFMSRMRVNTTRVKPHIAQSTYMRHGTAPAQGERQFKIVLGRT